MNRVFARRQRQRRARHNRLALARRLRKNARVPTALPGLFLAATTSSPMEQLRHVSKDAWINLAICVIAIVAIGRLWRALKHFNDYAPWFAVVLAGSFIG